MKSGVAEMLPMPVAGGDPEAITLRFNLQSRIRVQPLLIALILNKVQSLLRETPYKDPNEN